MKENEIILKNLRFTKDFNLPINNIFTPTLFNYYRELYSDFWPHKEEELMNKEIENIGSVEEWISKCGKFRDTIIGSLFESKEYQDFIACDMSKYSIPKQDIGDRSCYTKETDGKCFISVDLEKANFQALKYSGVVQDDTYEDLIYRYDGGEYIARSKYLRQVIFGKLNPKRTITVERFLINQVKEHLPSALKLFSFGNDELIYEYHDLIDFEAIRENIQESLGIKVHIEPVYIKKLNILNSRGSEVEAYVRKNLLTGKEKLKKASTTFFPQIYKLWKGLDIINADRQFFCEDQIATFNEPLILKENEE